MSRAILAIVLVLGFLVGGLLLLRSSASQRLPPDVLEKARKRNAELAAQEKDDDA